MQRRALRRILLLVATVAGVAVGPTLPAQYQLYTFYGAAANDEFGRSVAAAGDVNNDGYDDIIAGARGADDIGSASGRARVLSGKDGSVLYTLFGTGTGDHFGVAVGGAGDVNNDGFDDVIVGAFGSNGNAGSARVVSGINGSTLYTFFGDSNNDEFGRSVAGAGDVNNDGFDDVIVGARYDDNNGSDSGSARVFSGINGSILYTFFGDSADDRFGLSVDGAGDVNNDGRDDLIVGAWGDDNNGSDSGSARVFSGANGSILYTFNGDSAGDFLGYSVAGAGDVNDDGRADVIAGAYGDDNNGSDSGSARVFSGANGSILYTFNGDSAGDWFGSSVDGAGDVNNDNHADLVVGAERDDNNGGNSGSARILWGIDGSKRMTFYGDARADAFGVSVARAGDANNDGFEDIVVGAYGVDQNGSRSGGVRVLSGLGCCPSTGQSCTTAPCQSCPSMVATTSGGAPTLNNSNFALELRNAPANMDYAILAISSPCVTPGTSYIMCDTIKLIQPLEFLAAISFTPGVSTCSTNIVVPAPVPADPTFLGYALGVQWAVSCSNSTILGTSITNCVSFVITN